MYKSGDRVLKSSSVCEALGTLDELNASLGFLQLSKLKSISSVAVQLQQDLFLLGGVIVQDNHEEVDTFFWENNVRRLEQDIDTYEKSLKPLSSFIIPGGSEEASRLHVARTVSRRFERRLISYVSSQNKQGYIVLEKYINRLSDLLFVMARYANEMLGIEDIPVSSHNS